MRFAQDWKDGGWNYSNNHSCWIKPHPIPPGPDGKRLLFVGDPADVNTLDGGASAAVTDTTGPFWEIDHDFDARFPVGAGTFASGAQVTAVGGNMTGGEEKHTLTEDELPEINPTSKAAAQVDIDQDGTRTIPGVGDGFNTEMSFNPLGGGEAHNNLPPYKGVYFIKRTARIYYKL